MSPEFEPGLIEAVLRRQAAERSPGIRLPPEVCPPVGLVFAEDPEHSRDEAIRALRTKLLLVREHARHSYVFAVLSPCHGEGRSRLCAELALSFAQLGRATLLVDADLRRPRQHLLFGAENHWGLAQSLANEDLPQLYGVRGIPDMALLTSGGVPGNPLELLAAGRFERLLKAWRRAYEFVVIDSPPVTRYSDGVVIASAARRALIVTRSPSTSFKDLKEMTRHLAAAPARVLGAVINRF